MVARSWTAAIQRCLWPNAFRGAAVAQASAQLQKAQQPYTVTDLQQQEQAVNQTDAQLQKATNPFTAQDLESAQAAVDQSQAQLASAQLGLGDTRVRAPVDGVIADVQVAPGATVGPTTTLMTLVPPQLELAINVAENQLRNIADGQQVLACCSSVWRLAIEVRGMGPRVEESKTRWNSRG